MAWTDIGELAALERELFPHDPWTEATWWSELAGRPRREYLVEVGPGGRVGQPGRVLGYAGLDHQGEVADLMTIAVAPEARGTRLGRRMLAVMVHRAGARGAERLMLEVRADNVLARSLYETAGFETLTVRRRYYQPGDVDAIVMGRGLVEEESRVD